MSDERNHIVGPPPLRPVSRDAPSAPTHLPGVVFREGEAKPWSAKINHGGKSWHLGTFGNETAAHAAYLAAKRRIANGLSPRDERDFAPKGVYERPNGKYEATIKVSRKRFALGTYNTEAEAKAAHEQAMKAKRAGLPITPKIRLLGRFATEAQVRAFLENPPVPKPRKRPEPDAPQPSPHKGVSYDRRNRLYKVQLRVDGRSRWWIFTDREQAIAKAKQVIATRGPQKRAATAKGYSRSARDGKFIAAIRYDGKPVYLGAYDDEQSARAAYVAAFERMRAGQHPIAEVEPGITAAGDYLVKVRDGGGVRIVGKYRTRDEAREAFFAARESA